MLECSDCLIIDETVSFNEDNQVLICADCLYWLELLDWADEMMEEYGWLEV